MAKVHITRAQEARAFVLMQNVISKKDDLVLYEDGWSDVRVMEMINQEFPHNKINVNHISQYRQDVFGNLYARRVAPEDALAAKLAELQTKLDELMLWAAARTRAPFKL